MARTDGSSDGGFALPVEGAWIAPDGEQIPVVEHLLAVQSRPEQFDLADREVRGASISQLREIAIGMIRRGWTRYRFLDGTHRFEVANAERAYRVITRTLDAVGALPHEFVTVSVVVPRREYAGTVAGVRRGRLRNRPRGQNRWRLS